MKKALVVIVIILAWYGCGLWGSHVAHDAMFKYICNFWATKVNAEYYGYDDVEEYSNDHAVSRSMWSNENGDLPFNLGIALGGPCTVLGGYVYAWAH